MEPMPVNLSIKIVPDEVVERLRMRAARHHRSLQGELLAIVEAAARSTPYLTPEEVLTEVRRLGLETPAEAAAIRGRKRPGRRPKTPATSGWHDGCAPA